jgi:hypothetical protein
VQAARCRRTAATFSTQDVLRFGAEPGAEEASFEACVDGTLIVRPTGAERATARQRDVQLFPALFVNGH